MKICHVVGAGDFSPHLLKVGKDDLVIAADAGFDHLKRAGIRADLYIGDGDSLGFVPDEINTVVLPTVKDDTDIHAAVKEGLLRGFTHFHVYGALGGKRFSHSLANLQVLLFLENKGAKGILLDENYSVFLLSEGTHTFDFEKGYFSLFDFEGGAIISVKNAKYPLEKATLPAHTTLGISNEGEKNTTVTVHKGKVFLVREP